MIEELGYKPRSVMNESREVPESGTHFPREYESVVYCTDSEGCITAVNDGWQNFASQNNGETVAGDLMLGSVIWKCIAHQSLREIYKLLFKRAQAGVPVSLTYRCDAPDRRRWWNLTIILLAENQMQFESKLLREELRPAVALLEAGHQRSEWFVQICSRCELVATESDEWLPVEQAVQRMGLMEGEELPQLSHGICPSCSDVLGKLVDKLKQVKLNR